MLVYGDHGDEADPLEVIAEVSARVRAGDIENARIEAGRLVQGLLDAEQASSGADELTPLSAASAEALVGLDFRRIEELSLPRRVTMKLPEGYAFYATYPELYAVAARRAPPGLRPIGIRSIGTSLAAALPDGARALSVRPAGHPFERRLQMGPRLRDELGKDRSYAIVDEGPGLSGRFAGLGASGEAVLRRARAVADAGFAPEVLGLRRGFLVQRWVDASPAQAVTVDEAASYIAFRSRALPAAPSAGASAARLVEMAEHNSGRELVAFRDRIDALARDMVRVETDNKLHAWEWLRSPDGRLWKADASDHCRAHDLVGCMDPAWDLAGASFELGLDQAALWRRFREQGGKGAQPEVLAFLRPCYLAFQLGAHALAADSNPGERTRLERAADRYAALLRDELGSPFTLQR